MPKISSEALQRLQSTIAALEEEYNTWRPHYQDIAKYVLPRRYIHLAERSPLANNSNKSRAAKHRNEKILDPTGTKALRTLAAGMLNGITSPARPWLRLRPAGFPSGEKLPLEHQRWFDEVTRRMLLTMAESNFYNCIAVLHLDLCCFGTGAMLIYEDYDEIIRCYNSPTGEFRLAQDYRRMVNTYTRVFYMTVAQMEAQFGIENCSQQVQNQWNKGGSARQTPHAICHLIEPNTDDKPEALPAKFAYREFYWEHAKTDGSLLSQKGFREKPGIFPRWEVTANDSYGTSPVMDAFGDILQLQQETLRKAQALDKLVNPPVVMEGFLRNNPGALLPGGQSVVPPSATFGAKPIYTVQPPLGEMTRDIAEIQLRIREMLHNDLFRMISNLDTVRSATEIDARKEEKLVLLGAVLERFENEALDPAVRRIFNILARKNLLPEPPAGLEISDVEIEYVSILSDAQKALTTASVERFAQFIGNLAGIAPEVLQTANWDELVRDYADRLNVPALALKSREEAQAALAQNAELENTREAALVGKDMTDAARNLSETELGGGQSALQMMLAS